MDHVLVSKFEGAEALRRRGHFREALDMYREVLKEDRFQPDALSALGSVCMKLGMTEEGLEAFHLVRVIRPDVETEMRLANHLVSLGRNKEALEVFEPLYAAGCEDELLFILFGQLLMNMSDWERAEEVAMRGLRLHPECPDFTMNLSKIMRATGKYEEALEYAQMTYRGNSVDISIYFNTAIVLLNLHRFQEGWQAYRARFHSLFGTHAIYDTDLTLWQGEDLTGKTIILAGEQGLGDELVFSMATQYFLDRADRVILHVNHKLTELMNQQYPDATFRLLAWRRQYQERAMHDAKMTRVIDYSWVDEEIEGGADYFLPIGEAFAHTRQKSEDFCVNPPMLTVPNDRVQKIKDWLDEHKMEGTNLVGLCWRSMVMSGLRNVLYMTADDFAEIISNVTKPTTFVNLQIGANPEELETITKAAEAAGHRFLNVEIVDLLNDLLSVASLIQCLDFNFVKPGTTNGCISGALGVPIISSRSYGELFGFGFKSYDAIRPSYLKLDGGWADMINRVNEDPTKFVDIAFEEHEKVGDFELMAKVFGSDDVDDWKRQISEVVFTREQRMAKLG